MKVFHTEAEWRPIWASIFKKNKKIGFVPTMGALHQGHLDLVAKSTASMDITLVSIFVNPTQFNSSDDFKKYPQTLESDLALLEAAGAAYVFVPSVTTLYPQPTRLRFDFGALEQVLEGKFRPGHFNGVGLVVAKLFHLLQPHRAFFGQKDLQQVAVIKRLVQDLSFTLSIEVVPTRREKDGLAMSSRNMRLNQEERQQALLLYQQLCLAKERLLAGDSWTTVLTDTEATFSNVANTKLEYFALLHPETFEIFDSFTQDVPRSICIAAYVGQVRLIDNLPIIP
uniref:pantoate--beta-alanine ligase n=1 Tax=Algoriphagus sp. TaxID=1872435 RepID=UPI004048D160